MDLAIGAKRVFVMMTLFAKDGSPKLVASCTYPLTGVGCVDRVYTDLATFQVGPGGPVVLETFGITFDELAARLDLPLRRAEDTAGHTAGHTAGDAPPG
jgi:3-oxoadipate CoA-transferase beta subunit